MTASNTFGAWLSSAGLVFFILFLLIFLLVVWGGRRN